MNKELDKGLMKTERDDYHLQKQLLTTMLGENMKNLSDQLVKPSLLGLIVRTEKEKQ